MFVRAIEDLSRFTRPIHSIYRGYASEKVWPGAATLFFVNEQGVAITCKHVAEQLVKAEQVNQQYLMFAQARFRLKKDSFYESNLAELETQYNMKPDNVIQIRHQFVGSFDQITGFEVHQHPKHDLAIIRFRGFTKTYYQSFARFLASDEDAKPGKMLCRLGYPFPEFSNFRYNYTVDGIEWTKEGNPRSPSFPIEGIITRLIASKGEIAGIEMSTPGLRGQSGGPLFDPDGLVYGMQSSTRHLHLGFDLENFEVPMSGGSKKVTNMPFLHVGQCVHVSVIKAFLTEHNIKFYVG